MGPHNKQGFRDTSALVLEWSADKRDEVLSALRRLGHIFILAETFCAKDDTPCVAAILPLDRQITDDYFRLACLITADINVRDMSDCWGATFITCAMPDGEFVAGGGAYLDAAERIYEGGQVKIDKFKRRGL